MAVAYIVTGKVWAEAHCMNAAVVRGRGVCRCVDEGCRSYKCWENVDKH